MNAYTHTPATMTLVSSEVAFLNSLNTVIVGGVSANIFHSQILLDLPKGIVDGTLGTELVINNAIEANALNFILNNHHIENDLSFIKEFLVRTLSITMFDPNQDFLNYDLENDLTIDHYCEMCGAYATHSIDGGDRVYHYCSMCYGND